MSPSRARCARHDRRRFLRRLGLAAAGTLLGSGCRPARRAAGAAGRPARLALMSDPRSLDPMRAPDIDGWRLARLIGDSLIDIDAGATPVPRLARRWQWRDEGRTLVFALDERARWHDGQAVTAADVVHTWRTAVDPEIALPELQQDFASVDTVEAHSPTEVVVRYREPFAPALLSWRLPVIPRHHADRVEQPLGCGPWRFADWQTGERLLFEANPDYHLGPPGIPGLRFEIIRDYGAQLDALISGLIDVAPLAPDGFRRVRDDEAFARRFEIVSYRMPYIFYIAWRSDRRPALFDDARVRRALSLAIDRQGFLDRVAEGLGDVGVTSFHPEIWGFDASIEPWPYDPERAARLLDAAGWQQRDRDGVRVRNGVPFRFRLLYAATSTQNDRIAGFVQAHLREVGIAMELEPADWSVVLDRSRTRRFDALMSGRMLGYDPDPYELWHSSQAAAGVNYCGYRVADVDALIERARRIHDRAERTAIYRRIQRRLHEDEPMTVLFYPRSRVAVSREIADFVSGPAGYIDFWPGPAGWRWRSAAESARAAIARWRG